MPVTALQHKYQLIKMASCARLRLFGVRSYISNSRGFHLFSAYNMPIKVGDRLPDADLFENAPNGKVTTSELTTGKKVIIFGVPGAFTPGCSKTHLPGYIADYEKFKEKGIDEIACVSVNDPFVMAAWGKDQNVQGKVRMLADTVGAFTKAVDLEAPNLAPVLGNVRSKRFSMLVEDGVVRVLNVEPDGTGLTCSLASSILAQL